MDALEFEEFDKLKERGLSDEDAKREARVCARDTFLNPLCDVQYPPKRSILLGSKLLFTRHC
jgi:hypothetical protein